MTLPFVFNVLVVLVGLLPVLIGVYAWRVLRGRDEDSPDDPPPPPTLPPPPVPQGPPAHRLATDRAPVRSTPARYPTHRRVLR